MTSTAASAFLLLLGAGSSDRLLLCRPAVTGEPGLAKADALAAAGRQLRVFLDYGVACETEGEAARAARRAGLSHVVSSVADGQTHGSRFSLALSSAEEKVVARREVTVAPGADAVPPLRVALAELADAVPRPPPRLGPWATAGAGAAILAAGGGLALLARSSARSRDAAGARRDWPAYVKDDASWRHRRTAAIALGAAGGAGIAVGLAWRFAF